MNTVEALKYFAIAVPTTIMMGAIATWMLLF